MEEKVLRILKKTNEYVSGTEIGNILGISRAAVWKIISKLKKKGYNIEAVTNRGYRITNWEFIYNESEIKSYINTKYLGHNLYFFDEVSSTNDIIKEIANKNECNGTIVIAEKQINGRGRLGRMWDSPKGSGAWLSVLLRPNIEPVQIPVITLITGLSVCNAINKLGNFNAVIRWPNDVLIDGKKICGILTEMNAEMERVNYVVIGIGINVNTEIFSDELKNTATSLSIVGGKRFSRALLIGYVLEELEKNYDIFLQNKKFDEFLSEYMKKCITLGKDIIVMDKEPYEAKAISVNKFGELMVKKSDGKINKIFSGEVRINVI